MSRPAFSAPAQATYGIGAPHIVARGSLPKTEWHLRSVNVIASLAYIWAFSYIYEHYISVAHQHLGMYYRPLIWWEVAFILGMSSLAAAALPTKLDRASGIFLWFLFVFFYIPAMSLTFMLGATQSSNYIMALLALTTAMILCSWAANRSAADKVSPHLIPDKILANWFLAAWVVMTIILVVRFGSIMSFSGVDDIYYQRTLAAEAAADTIVSYIRTHYNYFICPFLIAYGLSAKVKIPAIAGVVGLVIAYTIDASKVTLIIPIVVFTFYFAQSRGRIDTYLYTGALAAFTLLCSFLVGYSGFMRYFVDVSIFRGIAIPGQTFTQYYDLFSSAGYTWWSNIRILDLIISPPDAFANDRDWPALGVIVGREYFSWVAGVNASANPFSGEGVAAAGPFGVVVIGAVLAIWLRIFDAASRPWHPLFVVLAITPLGMALSNAHLSTVLISFGGAAWTLLLFACRPAGGAGDFVPGNRISGARR